MASARKGPARGARGAGAPDTVAPPVNVKAQVVEGVAWKIAAQIVSALSRLVVGVILARLLTRDAFGVAGMALVIAAFVSIFADLNLGSALIQRDRLTEADRSTTFWTTLGLGTVLTVAGILWSGEVGAFFGHPEVGPLFAALSASFVLTGLSSTQNALLTRELAFRSLQIRQIVATLAGAVTGITLAALGTGPWAIIGMTLAAEATSAVVLWGASPWRPRFIYSLVSLRDTGRFGIKLFGASLLSYLSLNGDNLLIGRFIGSVALGTYSLAYNVMSIPMSMLAAPISQVAFPALSRLKSDRDRLRSAWLRGKRISSLFIAPAFVGLIVIAPDLVPAMFGSKWNPAIPVVQILSLGLLTQAVGTLNWTMLIALGEGGTYFWLNALQAAATFGGFAIGLHWGIVGVAASFAIVRWPLTVLDTHFAARKVPVPTGDALRAALYPALPLSLAMAGLTYLTRLELRAAGVPQLARVGLTIGVACIAYAALVRLVDAELFAEVKSLLPRRFAALRTRAQS
jgi:O-antigen/teichoic acid export membrane protein